jgi:hypothetical protein
MYSPEKVTKQMYLDTHNFNEAGICQVCGFSYTAQKLYYGQLFAPEIGNEAPPLMLVEPCQAIKTMKETPKYANLPTPETLDVPEFQ